MAKENVKNPPVVVNMSKKMFEGHVALRQVSAVFSATGKCIVAAKPILNIEDANVVDIIFGRVGGDSDRIITEVVEVGCYVKLQSLQHNGRPVALTYSQNPDDWNDDLLNSFLGNVLHIASTFQTEAQKLRRLVEKRELSEQQVNAMLASGALNEELGKKFLSNFTEMYNMVSQNNSGPKKKFDSSGDK